MKTHEIAVGIVQEGGRVLLLKRAKDSFTDTLILPGGKVEPGERLEAAVAREVFEETGVRAAALRRVGFYDETVFEAGAVTHCHKITIYRVTPDSFDYRDSEEGAVFALSVPEIRDRRAEINPSDYRMIERVCFNREEGFRARVEVERVEGKYRILAEEDL